ncbi:Zn-ribbon domain-containing OB-fold protein [Myxococcota bacterium]
MEAPRHWRTQAARYALMGATCQKCGTLACPPRTLCTECNGRTSEPHRLSGLGKVYSYSTLLQGPNGFAEFAPYTVALIQLKEGPMVAAQLTDVDREELRIGLPVEMVTRRLRDDDPDGIVLYGYKFRPRLVARNE